MCEPSPVRKALERLTIGQVESARDTALKRATEAADAAEADIYRRVADECSAELEDKLMAVATRAVVDESQRTDRQMRGLLQQAVNR
jgi:GH15 family glucan-1,4-alpha-glucosidase